MHSSNWLLGVRINEIHDGDVRDVWVLIDEGALGTLHLSRVGFLPALQALVAECVATTDEQAGLALPRGFVPLVTDWAGEHGGQLSSLTWPRCRTMSAANVTATSAFASVEPPRRLAAISAPLSLAAFCPI